MAESVMDLFSVLGLCTESVTGA